MNRKDGTKKLTPHKLTLRKETLRRLPRELTEQQIARALGGSDEGDRVIPTFTVSEDLRLCTQ